MLVNIMDNSRVEIWPDHPPAEVVEKERERFRGSWGFCFSFFRM